MKSWTKFVESLELDKRILAAKLLVSSGFYSFFFGFIMGFICFFSWVLYVFFIGFIRFFIVFIWF